MGIARREPLQCGLTAPIARNFARTGCRIPGTAPSVPPRFPDKGRGRSSAAGSRPRSSAGNPLWLPVSRPEPPGCLNRRRRDNHVDCHRYAYRKNHSDPRTDGHLRRNTPSHPRLDPRASNHPLPDSRGHTFAPDCPASSAIDPTPPADLKKCNAMPLHLRGRNA